MSRVVVAKKSGIMQAEKLSAEEYSRLLASGLQVLSGESDTSKAVKTFIPEGVVGMKTNCLTGRLFSTRVALVDALSGLLTKCGINENDLVVWERTSRELSKGGFELNASSFGRRCFGTDAVDVGYDRDFYSSGDVSSLVTRVLTDIVRHNINLPVLKDHSLAGLSAGMKNMYGAINNPNKYHDNNCDPFVAHVCALEPVRLKNNLTIIDATLVQYNGGPGYMPAFLDPYGGLIISDDPVAADCIALEILEEVRRRNNVTTLDRAQRPVKYLRSAGNLGLGVAERSKIDLVVLKVQDEDVRVVKGLF